MAEIEISVPEGTISKLEEIRKENGLKDYSETIDFPMKELKEKSDE